MKRIKIAEFRAKNIKDNPMTTIEVEEERGEYYYITFNDYRGHKYRSLEEAKNDIQELWGDWYGFKLLV